MAYIEPNSELILCENVPLDPTYEHTWWFPVENGQELQIQKVESYSNPLLHLRRQYYQRKDRGVIRIERPYEDVLYCNYMAFKNTSFENKWFYAFIDKVEYVNNITTEISYTIDVLMTWYFDYEFEPCWIERQHSTTDVAGDNLLAENLETGEYVINSAEYIAAGQNRILVATTFQQSEGFPPASGKYWGNVYSGCDIREYTAENLNSFLSDVTEAGKSDGIVAIYMCPDLYWRHTTAGGALSGESFTYSRPASLNGYTPRNQKLFTYPYCFAYVSNDSGNTAVYPYEYFSNPSSISFTVKGTCMPPVTGIIYPNNYKGWLANTDEKLTISGFPMCSYNIDAYRAWLAQNTGALVAQGAPLILEAVGGLAMAIASVATGGLTSGAGALVLAETGGSIFDQRNGRMGGGLGGVLGGFNQNMGDGWFTRTLQLAGQFRDHYIKPPQAGGSLAGCVEFGSNIKNFLVASKTITAQFARIIDSFFDKYGYAQNKLDRPNVNARPCWTFVKTAGCTIKEHDGRSVPADDTRTIEKIHDKGITYWKYNVNFCDYTQNNRPV